MSKVVKVSGGYPLIGEVELIPNKNAFLPALAASLLCHKNITYKDVPETSDIALILDLITRMGGSAKRQGKNVIINCSGINTHIVPSPNGRAIRASLMFAGPLLARFGKASVPLPGGCKLGHRGIGAHVDNFQKLGIQVFSEPDKVSFEDPLFGKLKGMRQLVALEASVTATENTLLYLSGIHAESHFIGAASEPHVTDLITLLSDMGADIAGAGGNSLQIKGKGFSQLKEATFQARYDYVDLVGYCVAAAVTDGNIRIKGANIPDIADVPIGWLELFNLKIVRDGTDIIVSRKADEPMFINHHGTFPMASSRLPKLYPRPWPGFPVDCIPVMIPLAASMDRGKLLIINWMYEDGFQLTRELRAMGASIFDSSPIRIMIDGKDSNFSGTGEVFPPLVIQSIKAVFLAALSAKKGSEFIIHGFDFLKRRYPDIIEKYESLGAKIEVMG